MSKNFINKVKMFVKKHPILCGIGASALAGTVCYIIGSKKGYSSGKSFAYSELQNVFDNGYRETNLITADLLWILWQKADYLQALPL